MNTVYLYEDSFFNEFEEDKMTGTEMFDTLGGIERNEIMGDVIMDDLTFDDTVFDSIVPDWKNRTVDSDVVGKKFPEKNNRIFSVRSFRTLLQFFCIKF